MRDLTKAQLTVGLLSYFATIWVVWKLLFTQADILSVIETILLQFISIMILSYVILALLEWVKIFDLKTNSTLTLLVLVTILILYNV